MKEQELNMTCIYPLLLIKDFGSFDKLSAAEKDFLSRVVKGRYYGLCVYMEDRENIRLYYKQHIAGSVSTPGYLNLPLVWEYWTKEN